MKPYVLLVEDEMPALVAVKAALESEGVEVSAVSAGHEAIAIFRERRPDLIILDIGLPDMTGIELAKQLKTGSAEGAPCIFLTGRGDMQTRLDCFRLGARDYIQKPFAIEELLARVRVHMDLQKTQVRLAHQIDELALRERLRQDLSDMIVHDLKAPIASILATLEIARLRGLLDAGALSAAGDIDTNANLLLLLINDLLDLSHAGEAKLKVSAGDCDLAPLFDRIKKFFAARCKTKELRLLMRLPASVGVVRTDSALLFRILANLISNAAGVAPTGTEIEVDAQARPPGLRLCVADRGPGVPDSEKRRIFEKFATTRKFDHLDSGSGVGLAFCNLAARSLGGRVWVEDRPGGGSLFYVDVAWLNASVDTAVRGRG